MYADELAWTLKDLPDSSYSIIAKPTLRDFDAILQNRNPTLNSDLAELAIAKCHRLVREALKQLDTDLHRAQR